MSALVGLTGPCELATLQAMLAPLRHRGPDDQGFFLDHGVGLGLARLAVQAPDEPGGAQSDESGRWWVVFDGYLANHVELRSRLQADGVQLRGRSNRELIAACFAREGLDAPRMLRGGFAIAAWDRHTRTLALSRDGAGLRSLCYHLDAGRLAFASEAKALLVLPGMPRAMDPDTLAAVFNLGFSPASNTLFVGIQRLDAGATLVFREGRVETRRSFTLEDAPSRGITGEQAADGLRMRLQQATREARRCDRETALFLDGELPSAALAASALDRDLCTLAVGVSDGSDPRERCRELAEHLGLPHADVRIAAPLSEALDFAIEALEEPRPMAPERPALLCALSQKTRVLLSAVGAREILAGDGLYQVLFPLLHTQRPVLQRFAGRVFGPRLNKLSRAFKSLLRTPHLDLVRHGLEMTLAAGEPPRVWAQYRGAWDFSGAVGRYLFQREFLDVVRFSSAREAAPYFGRAGRLPLEDVQWCEFHTRLPRQVLFEEERLAAACGLEVRAPFLDDEVLRYAFTVPLELKREHGLLFALLREASRDRVTADILSRGMFALPRLEARARREELLALARERLTDPAFLRLGVFRRSWIEDLCRRRVSEALRWHYDMLWLMLGTARWVERFLAPPARFEASAAPPCVVDKRLAIPAT